MDSHFFFAALATSEKAIRHEIVWTGRRGKPTSMAYGGRPMTWRMKHAGAPRIQH
jgi:hypothetical protein